VGDGWVGGLGSCAKRDTLIGSELGVGRLARSAMRRPNGPLSRAAARPQPSNGRLLSSSERYPEEEEVRRRREEEGTGRTGARATGESREEVRRPGGGSHKRKKIRYM
jgi:hypothetical protein